MVRAHSVEQACDGFAVAAPANLLLCHGGGDDDGGDDGDGDDGGGDDNNLTCW